MSTRLDGAYGLRDVCLSIPCVVGIEGVEAYVTPALSEEEHVGLRASAETLIQSRNGLVIAG